MPERRALALRACRGGYEHPGAALNAGALFGIPIVGGRRPSARAGRDRRGRGRLRACSSQSMAKRAGTYTGAKVADFQAVQIKVARARCLIDSARTLLRQSAIALQDMAARDEVPDLATKLRFRAHSAFAVNQAREAVETLWSCYGAQGLYTRDPLAAPPARRDGDEPALLVQLRHRGRGLRPARARRQIRQSDDV